MGEKGKEKEKQEETPNSEEEEVQSYAHLSQRTEAHEGPMLEALAGVIAHRSPAAEQVLLIRLCGQQMSPHWSQYYTKVQFSTRVFFTKWKEILL